MYILSIIIILLLITNVIFSLSLIFIERKNPTTTWAWLLIMIMLPGLGFIIYLLIGQNFSREKLFKDKRKNDKQKRKELSNS